MRRRDFITLLGGGAFLFLRVNAAAQEGYYVRATINGIRASTQNSKETTEVRAAI
jgi:hypothetical protein